MTDEVFQAGLPRWLVSGRSVKLRTNILTELVPWQNCIFNTPFKGFLVIHFTILFIGLIEGNVYLSRSFVFVILHLILSCAKSFEFITKTRLYNFDPLQPHFYIVKLGFTGVCIIFLISAQKHRLWYSLEPPRRGGSNEYSQSMF